MARDARYHYRTQATSIEGATDIFLSDEEMNAYHDDFRKKAIQYFDEHKMDDVELSISSADETLLDQLKKVSSSEHF